MNGPLIVAGWIAVSNLEKLSMITHPLSPEFLGKFNQIYRSFAWHNGPAASA